MWTKENTQKKKKSVINIVHILLVEKQNTFKSLKKKKEQLFKKILFSFDLFS